MNELVTISRLKEAQTAIREIKDLSELKRLADQSEALKQYAIAQRLGRETQNEITEYNLHVTRQMGIVSAGLAKASHDRGNQYRKEAKSDVRTQPKHDMLAQAGVSKQRANEAEALAAIPEDEFEQIVEQKKDSDKLTKTAVMQEVKRAQKQQQRTELEEHGKTIEVDYDLRFGDFMEVLADVPDGSVDCIITDPPYPHEFIDCWSKLSEYAHRKLRPNGFCVAYSGQMYLPEVMSRMSEHLDYYWCMSVFLPGGTQIVNGVNMMCRWKPILLYQNGKKCIRDTAIDDLLTNDRANKDGHDWQQGESGVAYLIEKFTKPGDTIIDPFCGAGTTLRIAKKLNRHCISAEIDERTYNIAKARLSV